MSSYCYACERALWRERFIDPVRRARKREYDRIYREGRRRAAGAPVRQYRTDRPRVSPGSSRERVPNALLREAFVESGMSGAQLARVLGFKRTTVKRGVRYPDSPDATYALRLLGLKPETKRGKCSVTIQYHNAVRIARALNRDPVDFGV